MRSIEDIVIRRRWAALVAGAAAAALALPLMAGAAPITSATVLEPEGFFRLCAEAQRDIANIDDAALTASGITLGGTIYAQEADFVLSKSAVDITENQIVTAAYMTYRDAARTQPEQIRCKMRTAESLGQGAWPGGSANNSGRFAVDPYFGFGAVGATLPTSLVDAPCSTVNQRTIDAVWGALSPAEQAAAPFAPPPFGSTLTTVPDVVVGSGPEWLGPFPAMVNNGGVLEVGSLALLVPTGAGGVPRLEGAHYCTLVAPEYLRDVLIGAAVVAP